jgi:prolyl oligopeptidase
MPVQRLFLSAAVLSLCVAAAPAETDPNLWLEEVQGERALAQVEKWNKATEATLTQMPGFETYRTRALALLDDKEQIAQPEDVLGDRVTNLWRDSNNPRGLWRIASVDSYASGKPQWRVLIDVDALGKQEGKSWVWHGADCLAPDYKRCLVALSDGGTDADVVREYDLEAGRFVDGGFMVPEAKSAVTWYDKDHLLVATDFGEGSLTSSGYPRVMKLWRRGTPLASARTLTEGQASDVGMGTFAAIDDGKRWPIISRGVTFWTNELWLAAAPDRLVKIPLPNDAQYQDVIGGRLIAKLNSPLSAGGRELPAGAIVSYSLGEIAAGRSPAPELVMTPTKSQAIEEVSASDDVLWVKVLDDVSGKLLALRRQADGSWSQEAMPLPANSTVHIMETAGERNLVFASVEGMLTPPALYAVTPGKAPQLVQGLPARFDASKFNVEQRFATSKDGTRVPYFLVRRKDVTGAAPALIHAYGGFRAAQTPTYLTGQPYRAGPLGLFWVEEGNAYVLANIRGGGEYGPAWHDAALRERRQNSFDDLHAVAEDLIAAGIGRKGSIGISGRSNGGVLVGAAMNQRPDLYSAVIAGSPLSDMQRYTQLLAGASWMGEYGDPQKPEDWAFISQYSPYQNLKRGVDYPAPFYYTSTLDDRVHPGHARKMVARLEQYGQPFYYHEHTEGGHAAGVDFSEDALRAALLMEYLKKELKAEER